MGANIGEDLEDVIPLKLGNIDLNEISAVRSVLQVRKQTFIDPNPN